MSNRLSHKGFLVLFHPIYSEPLKTLFHLSLVIVLDHLVLKVNYSFPPDLFIPPFNDVPLKLGHCPWPSCFKGLSFFSARFIHNPLKWCSIKAGSLSLAILFSNRARGGHRTLAAMSRRCRRGPSRTLQNRSV